MNDTNTTIDASAIEDPQSSAQDDTAPPKVKKTRGPRLYYPRSVKDADGGYTRAAGGVVKIGDFTTRLISREEAEALTTCDYNTAQKVASILWSDFMRFSTSKFETTPKTGQSFFESVIERTLAKVQMPQFQAKFKKLRAQEAILAMQKKAMEDAGKLSVEELQELLARKQNS